MYSGLARRERHEHLTGTGNQGNDGSSFGEVGLFLRNYFKNGHAEE